MNTKSIGQKIREARKQKGLTQDELARSCRLDIRTIQRIEAEEVTPRMYTIGLLHEMLGETFEINIQKDLIQKEIQEYRRIFLYRKRIRIGISITILVLLISVTLLAFPSWELFGMPKLQWAPYFYLIMFGLLIGIGMVWRCPACNGLLGDVINTKYCSKCGMKFKD